MSSPRILRAAALGAAILLLAGCQVRPLYAPGPSGAAPQQALPAVDVELPQTRVEQVFRNALLFEMRGGGAAATPLYKLGFRLVVIEQAVAIEPITGTPAAYQLAGSIAVQLRDAGTGEILFEDRANAAASFNRSSQNFANIRARRDAEDRVAAEMARLVQVRLATFFATR